MTIFDYLVLFVLLASVVISLLRGLISEILSLLGWVLAFVVANTYGASLAAMLPAAIPGEVTRLLVGFVALFLGARLLVGLMNMVLNALLKATGLSLVDHTLGALFGAARGLVIVLSVVILCGMTALPQQAFWRDALLSPMAEAGAHAVKPYLPYAYAKHVQF